MDIVSLNLGIELKTAAIPVVQAEWRIATKKLFPCVNRC